MSLLSEFFLNLLKDKLLGNLLSREPMHFFYPHANKLPFENSQKHNLEDPCLLEAWIPLFLYLNYRKNRTEIKSLALKTAL